jgi:transposase InsO family protein
VVVPARASLPPTPSEVEVVCDFARAHPKLGYKRLSWQMMVEEVAYLRPHQVYTVLQAHELLHRHPSAPPPALKRPAEPDHPDQVWHIDLMYLYIRPRWYYLVDILDGYSRFLVHWSLNPTMVADTVTRTVQEALDGLKERRAGEPKLVHDHGSQFISAEWRALVAGSEVTDIATRVAHPQSNGRLERLHRTHREEGLADEGVDDYYQALDVLTDWDHYYNHQRVHSALRYLRPIDYYRGDVAACLAERQQRLTVAREARRTYWASH